MISTSSKLEYCVQKTTIQRAVGLRIYYFAYMKSPPLFRVPSILRSCYSNYELKTLSLNEILKFKMAARGKFKSKNTRYSYPIFFQH